MRISFILVILLMSCSPSPPASSPAALPTETLTLPKDEAVSVTDDLTLVNLGVGYAHLTDGGNLSDAELRVTWGDTTQTVRLFKESHDDPQARAVVGPYRIILEEVAAYNSGAAFIRVERVDDKD